MWIDRVLYYCIWAYKPAKKWIVVTGVIELPFGKLRMSGAGEGGEREKSEVIS